MSPPVMVCIVMAPFAEHWNVTALDFSLNKALFYLTEFYGVYRIDSVCLISTVSIL